jgi:lipid II:glycine glycyltransferase (peptidoglycan interpeptide bridge formation enzyme)
MIELLLEKGVSGQLASCYFAIHQEQMIGGLLILWGGLTASYYTPCSLASARTLQPGPALIDCAVKDARQRGIRYWNWESSPSRESGVYRYKQKWGSLEQDYRIYLVPFRELDDYRQLGKGKLASEFPYFFVYPYDQL